MEQKILAELNEELLAVIEHPLVVRVIKDGKVIMMIAPLAGRLL